MINVQRFRMGRRSFSGTARHCTTDDDKGGAGISNAIVVIPCSAFGVAPVPSAEMQALHIVRPEQATAAHTLPPAGTAHHARRLVVSIKHGFAPRSVVLRPCAQRTHGNSVSQRPPIQQTRRALYRPKSRRAGSAAPRGHQRGVGALLTIANILFGCISLF